MSGAKWHWTFFTKSASAEPVCNYHYGSFSAKAAHWKWGGILSMKLETLHDLYVNELHDLYDAENQVVKALPKMIESSQSTELRNALANHLEETRGQVARLERIFQMHGEDIKGEKCKGLRGIIDEGEDLIKHDDNLNVRDAAIIAAAQKVEHYEMAGYGSVRTWAEMMGHQQAAQLLQQTLNEEGEADKKLTRIAQTLNAEAERGAA
jgi:ferritin-like metal-binding protein YciE